MPLRIFIVLKSHLHKDLHNMYDKQENTYCILLSLNTQMWLYKIRPKTFLEWIIDITWS